MISAREVKEITNNKNDNGVNEILKRLEKKILKNAEGGYNCLYVSMFDLGKTDGRIANVIDELTKRGYIVWQDGGYKVIKW